MKWVTAVLIGTWVSLLAVNGAAQEFTPEPCSNEITGDSSCQLIAWSVLQNPQPEPPASSPGGQPEQQIAAPKFEPAASQVELTGVVLKLGERCVLEVGDNFYELDDQPKTAPYERRRVRILATLADGRKIVHITTVELVP